MTSDLTCRHGYHECKTCQASLEVSGLDLLTGTPQRKIWVVGQQIERSPGKLLTQRLNHPEIPMSDSEDARLRQFCRDIGKRVPDRNREMIITRYISSPEGRRHLAESVAEMKARPLRMMGCSNYMSYSKIARDLFPIQQLPPGALALYNKDE